MRTVKCWAGSRECTLPCTSGSSEKQCRIYGTFAACCGSGKAITGKNEKEIKDLGGIQIDKEGRTVSVDGKPIELSLREYELLLYLVQNENIALSRDKILNNVWNYDYYGDTRTIDSHVKKIRHKLGKKGKYIKTIRGIGYKFEVK